MTLDGVTSFLRLKHDTNTCKRMLTSVTLYKSDISHMTKITAMPIYGKNPLKNLLQNQKAGDLGTWNVALGMWGLPSLFK